MHSTTYSFPARQFAVNFFQCLFVQLHASHASVYDHTPTQLSYHPPTNIPQPFLCTPCRS